ncbi:small-conductance mechanosensitive channel [Arcanobacterium pluranimalium]|uniref:mechanosensitive ion channel family protein n=1 Tax=Arcanobacterium pluranimalium TaxID=108028 RepID=UPI00195E795E|nr:mechanosensitive ion channel family protein [Arcanobacterium pluranimalium]MBM7824209.1 small-conductance mechanosensitive channel [Arcanobacterium pluranimalium]
MNQWMATTGDGATSEAVEATFDVLQVVLGVVLGALGGFIAGLLLLAIGRMIVRRRSQIQPLMNATSRPSIVALMLVGAWIGFNFADGRVNTAAAPAWLENVDHAFLVLVILAGTWLAVGVVNGAMGVIHNKMRESSERRAKRVQTQTQILNRVIVVVIWILGIGGVLLTFPSARTAGASLFASAGLVSVVAGLAAQTTLGNVFAGLQLAFSDSIRVGDIVYYKDNYTTVEEITLTYVVLAVWDGRRIIVPSSLMTTQSFENWTRRAPEMLGDVTWEVDWALPLTAARKQLEFLLRNTDLWDGETGVLQISNAAGGTLQMRAVISAKDSATLVDLKNYLREQMIHWIQTEAPQAIPRQRRYFDEPVEIVEAAHQTNKQLEDRIEREEPVQYLPDVWPESVGNPAAVAQDRQRTTVLSVKDIKEMRDIPPLPQDSPAETIVMAPITPDMEDPRKKKPASDQSSSNSRELRTSDSGELTNTDVRAGHEASLFSGSPSAEMRKQHFSGPGEEAFAERNRKIEEIEEAEKGGSKNFSSSENPEQGSEQSSESGRDAEGGRGTEDARDAVDVKRSSDVAQASVSSDSGTAHNQAQGHAHNQAQTGAELTRDQRQEPAKRTLNHANKSMEANSDMHHEDSAAHGTESSGDISE